MSHISSLIDLFQVAWPTILMLDLSRYLVAAGGLAVVLALIGGPIAKRRIQAKRAAGTDIRREIGFSLSTVILFSLVGFCVYAGGQYGMFRIYGGAMPGSGRLLFEFSALVLLHDSYFYWAHRGMHTRWLFRKVHRLHHKSRTPTPWAAYAFAPPEAIVEALFLPLAGLLVAMHEITVLLFLTHMILRNVIGHAGFEIFPGWWLRVPLLRCITTTTHHDLHHSHGYNFGLYFTWWDRWMNTEHPEYQSRFLAATHSHGRLDLTP